MTPSRLETIKFIVLGLISALLGAVLGGILLTFAVVASPAWNGQFVATIPIGGFLGAIATTVTFAVRFARCNHKIAAALICLSGGLVPLVDSLYRGVLTLLILQELGKTDPEFAQNFLFWVGVPFVVSLSLVLWGVVYLARLDKRAV